MGEGEETVHPSQEKPSRRSSQRTRGLGTVYRRGSMWWVQYCFLGKVYRESSGSESRPDAVRLLRKRLEEMGRGRLVGPNLERTTFEELAAMLLDEYRANRRRSTDRVARSVEHLRRVFALARAVEITTDRISRYSADRQAEGAANATVNRELSALKRMFRLGERAGKVGLRPYVPMLREDNTRTGFFEEREFRAVLRNLPEDLRPVFEVAYATGWRVRSEIVTRQKGHVDLAAGWLRLEPGEAKNRDGRMFPLMPRLREVLERQLNRTREVEMEGGRVIPWLFHRDGKPIRSFYRAWRTACKKAGLAGRIPHDFRRTAVRNLERAGVPRSTAMKMVGHRTEAIYRRYAIADEAMLREGAEKLAALHASVSETPGKVVVLRDARS
jgi:integrase